MSIRPVFAAFLLALLSGLAAAAEPEWEGLPDGSLGQKTEFTGTEGIKIPAYARKPAGDGPFPVVLMIHGGGRSEQATYGLGRSAQPPTADFIKAGWAIYSIDYRPTTRMMEEVEIEDGIEAVKHVRTLQYVDPGRVGILGGSHGGHLASRLISRVDVRGAVLDAPAAIDLIEDRKAADRGEKVVGILSKLAAEMEKRLGGTSEEIARDPKRFGYSSPLTEASQVRCPVLIVSGLNDPASPTSVVTLYVDRLRAAGKSVETYMPDNGPHGFYFGRPDIPEWKESSRRATAFFRKCFGEKAGEAEERKNP